MELFWGYLTTAMNTNDFVNNFVNDFDEIGHCGKVVKKFKFLMEKKDVKLFWGYFWGYLYGFVKDFVNDFDEIGHCGKVFLSISILVSLVNHSVNDINDKNVFLNHFVNDFVNTKVNKVNNSLNVKI